MKNTHFCTPRHFSLWQKILTLIVIQIFVFVHIEPAYAGPSLKPRSCVQTQVDTCVDNTPCKTLPSGITICLNNAPLPLPVGATQIQESCWQYSAQFDCIDSAVYDTCSALQNKGCGQVGSVCQTDSFGNPIALSNGTCTSFTQQYECPVEPPQSYTIQNCSSSTVCSSGNCWSTAATPNADFANAATQMEIVRQASVYMDSNMRVFSGNPESCTEGYGGLRKCCDGSGGGRSNNSILKSTAAQVAMSAAWYFAKPYATQASAYVQDFMFGPNGVQQWALDGVHALFNFSTEAEVSSTISGEVLGSATEGSIAGTSGFGAFGITYGTEIGSNVGATIGGSSFAGSLSTQTAGTIIEGAGTGGGPLVSLGNGFAFDPVSLGVTIAITILIKMLSCTMDEAKLQMHKGSNLCTPVGTYCSQKILWVCTVNTQAYCCYNSILARIINEQGRPQLGKTYGPPQSPDCSGFTINEVQQLDFSKIDLSEFTNSIIPTLPNAPNVQGIQTNVGQRMSTVTTNNTAPPLGN